MCDLDYKATLDSDNNPVKSKLHKNQITSKIKIKITHGKTVKTV